VTKKLFHVDPYLKECDATVTKIQEKNVWLDKTIFFAFSGGQESDSGIINNIPVVEVKKEGKDIIHVLESNPDFSEGDSVKCVIDWDKRNSIMKLHTSAHIVYFFLVEKIGKIDMIGSNVTSTKSRIDFNYDKSISEILPELENKVNEFISQSHKVETGEDENNKGRFWWNVEGIEKMPCGGTHIKNTTEIGKIKLKRKNIGAGKERIEITLA